MKYNPQETKAKQDCLELWSRITLLSEETLARFDDSEPISIKNHVLKTMGEDPSKVLYSCPLCDYYRTKKNPAYEWHAEAKIIARGYAITDYYKACSGCPICKDVKTRVENLAAVTDLPPCMFATAYGPWSEIPSRENAEDFYEYLKTIMANHDNMWKVVNNKEFDRSAHFFPTEEEARAFMHKEGISDKIGARNGPYHIDDIPTLKKDGYQYGFWNKRERCPDCGAEMLGRVNTYPPYCDSTYEEWSCPECGYGWGSSV